MTAAKAGNRAGGAARRQSVLTARQERFAQEYVKDLNATEAARRAGYSQPQKQGSQVLGGKLTQVRVAELQAIRAAGVKVDADFVLRRLIEEVNADAAELFDRDGRLLPVAQWPTPWRRGLVSTIRTRELFGRGEERAVQIGVQTDIVLADRTRRLELLGRHIQVNAFAPDKVQLGLDTPLQELFRQIAGNVIRPASERAQVIDHDATPQLQDQRGEDVEEVEVYNPAGASTGEV